jgi:hypothetical protein
MIRRRPIQYIPESQNFSTFSNNVPAEYGDDKPLEYEASDGGEQVENLFSKIQAEQILTSLLLCLDNRDKVILLYQILQGAGYDLQQDDCAKTLSLSHNAYVILIKNVRRKCVKILKRRK